MSFLDQLLTIIPAERFKQDEPLSAHTYTKLGGKADYFVAPHTYEEVQAVLELAHRENVPFMILGFGSNLIVRDGGLRGIVLNLNELNTVRRDGNRIIAQAGAAIIDVSRQALTEELSGLEFACGIPGTVGGAVYMNAGAYGGETKDVIASAVVLTPDGELLTLSKDELDLDYRTSRVSKEGLIVLEATFELDPLGYEAIKDVMDDLTHKRESKQPLEYPSCGSVFKRPPGYFAGKLIQDCGLQGKRIGGAEVSLKHAGFIVNINQATATEYISLIRHVQATVKQKFEIELEPEVKIIGEDIAVENA
ncbi:UDP-N-acetylmuramate dehydrogenase [Exiguobacterium sp. SH3S2]|uniref:UDP-N-acetylmuramate dehydrogenase n=1 Tax=unclassified Exiguobacterium TaxID=2644629 RepID=UPI001039334F|nr:MULTISPECIES: UDP-N-acetylmuramate dehydrogenase [unclassified Exiguobacterium]TCI25028.1 UDP-N-acetylmuramate dehydrogenase [Exiguobacterium sp. SH5S4]TCI47219.1 UDP-N-acetylmuramate dehydrogenase [Exiguobacterium sp. SH3S3]TCI51818.1 UDP-N-acetylmuramate dehydrogenase [Exiguobacterium sp. SH5S13]TCI62274.1 UDP-N-acetylmuramate dehydrogenase [Exiguobacterium sp. SH3S1]TCI62367.1 UDP-N-acetylmuramate dehydrogenase [Exiguobacterium sp. SH3S2]